MSTTSASSTTRLSRPSSVVSSMEPISAFNITNKDITKTTAAAVLSKDRTCEHQIDFTAEALKSTALAMSSQASQCYYQ